MALLVDCSAIQDAIRAARADIIEQLVDAPAKVAGHSRVSDVERAFENLEASLDACRCALDA
ncbi:MAG: hypothetical protein ABIY37_12345 [Devosia sp.]